ncbi:GNAT family N-acetyltransferase [Granulicella sp. WH15]|uniref:GNAT family N-acetyltransferase n=1 Tax=Granulicella sp. WH15 TaxID=2602070 RepID=UPI00136764A0|nr:GNAT family N-acetyltransferase [Granulicella sp. WH15]QHN05028.1 GNAT family N-acetyltransferase [Granulicella sp. WH15]
MIVIREASGAVEVEWVRALMRDYAAYLAGGPAGICIEGFEAELASLPGAYSSPSGTLLVALRDGTPVGCCAIKPIRVQSAAPDERSCEMKRLWVAPEARGLGLGRRLVDRAVEWARAAGYTALYLDTAPAAMPEANRLYGAMGFVEIDRFNDNPVPGIVFFRLQLGR